MRHAHTLIAAILLAAATAGAVSPTRIQVAFGDRADLARLATLVTVEEVRARSVEALATPAQLAGLERRGIAWAPVAIETNAVTMCPSGWVEDPERGWDCYPSYPQYVALLELLAADYPDRCRLESLGPTANQLRSHDLWALRISDHPEVEEDEPEVLLVSSLHGDETTGFILLLRLADHLLTGYGADAAATALVDGVELWLVPAGNPDGTYFAGDHTVAGASRYFTTASGDSAWVDPNRNYPDPVLGDHADGFPWWPETVAMMAFAEDHSVVLSANLHGGAEVVNYPWDSSSRRHADDEWLYHVSREYADLAHAASPGGYLTDLDDGVTNGWDWYTVFGGRQDYTTYFHGGRELTLELSAVKLLDSSQLDAHWQYNRASLLAWVGRSLTGVRGRVVDADGRPLAATVEVVGHDRAVDRSWVTTDPDVGDFHRLLLPGAYTVRFTAPGHHQLEVAGVAVTAGDATRLDVVLHPDVARDVSGLVTWRLGGAPVVGARVEVLGLGGAAATTAAAGRAARAAGAYGPPTFAVSAERAHELVVEWPVTPTPDERDFVLSRVRLDAPSEVGEALGQELANETAPGEEVE